MLEIREIEPTKKNLRMFTQFQIDLYDGNPCYVPPLMTDDIETLSADDNPAFEYCESVLYMAFRDGRPVGRIAGILNKNANEKHHRRQLRFGFLDFIDDHEVSEALFEALEKWGHEHGLDEIVGPLGFSDMDHEGMLVEGFDELSTMATIYNYPYYPEHLERLGFRKDNDWVEYLLEVPDTVPDKYMRVAEIVRKKYGLRNIKYKSRKRVKKEYGHALFHLINQAYDGLYQYCRLTETQIEYYIDIYLGLLDLDLLSLVVDKDSRLVGVGIALQSMSRGLQKSKGKMLPFGWYHLLKGLRGSNDRVDLLLVAVHPDYQNKGANSLIFTDLLPYFIKKGYKYAESNPEMETNSKVQTQWEYFNHRQHRRRRAYIKKISSKP